MALPKNRGDREYEKFVEDASGDVALRTALTVKDISIGAVEIKDHTSDDRTHVTASKELTTINPTLALLVGEVQASPTANTVLDRLKTIASGQLADGHNVTVDNVIGAGVYIRPGSGTTFAISAAALPLPTGAATSAKQLADGHNVVISGVPSVSSATNTKVSVGSTTTSVLAAKADRKFAVLVNDSNEEIYLNLSGTAVMNEGIRLNANGGAYEINLNNLYTGAIYAICSSGSKNLTVVEG